MKRPFFRLWRLGFFGLAWFALIPDGNAWELPHVDARIEFHFDVVTAPQLCKPTAPWYAYFPVDPRMAPSPQSTRYPPWPAQFPPQASPPAVPREAGRQAMDMNVPRATQASQLWRGQSPSGMNVQPVGYNSFQAPSYWYRNP